MNNNHINNNHGIRKKSRGMNLGLQWWRKLTLPRRGKKDSMLYPSSLCESQLLRLRERTQALRKSLLAPRTTRSKQLSEATWSDIHKGGIITRPKGGCLQSMGWFIENGKQVLYPEDVLFLVDKGSLCLRVDGLVTSIQKTWSLCMQFLNMEEYLTYAFLRRCGYVVRRYHHENNNCNDLKLLPKWSVWKVNGYKRRNENNLDGHDGSGKPLFHVIVYALENQTPYIKDIVKCAKLSTSERDRTRTRIAVIDRGVVVFTDVAENATPMSDRFINRLQHAQKQVAIQLRQGNASAIFDDDFLKAFEERKTDHVNNKENANNNLICLNKNNIENH